MNSASKIIPANKEALNHIGHKQKVLKQYPSFNHILPWRTVEKQSCYCENCKKGFIKFTVVDDEGIRIKHQENTTFEN